jgi:hypothetical protein
LPHVRELVRQQPLAGGRSGRVAAGREGDVLADGVGAGGEGARGGGRRGIGVYPDAREVVPEAALHSRL